jgi:NAD(P)-dependent dehydrogenase (short-subunit alcohol dehydrogenase family)
MVRTLQGQTIVILGGTSGIGYGAAKLFLETSEADIVIGSSTAERVEAAVSSLSELQGAHGRITGYQVNLDGSTASEKSIAEFFDKVGTVNHLIYTAGEALGPFLSIETVTREAAEGKFGVRYWGLLASVKTALSCIPKSHESSITVTAGTVVFRPKKGWVVGAGICSAVEGLTRELAVDLAPIRVNCIAPGPIVETPLWSNLDQKMIDSMALGLKEKSLTHELGLVEDVAEAYGYVVRGNFTAGQTLVVDGGEYLC